MKNADNKILLIGAGGHAASVADALICGSKYSHIGLIAPEAPSWQMQGVEYLGNDDCINDCFKNGYTAAVITIGSVGDTALRRRFYDSLKNIGFELPAVIDPSAVIAKNAVIGEGSFIGKNAVVNAGAKIGQCAIINTAAVVEHDCVVGDFAHISVGAVLCGTVNIGNDTHIGAKAVVIQGITVGSGSLIGSASNVVKPVGDNVVAFGNPCVVIKER